MGNLVRCFECKYFYGLDYTNSTIPYINLRPFGCLIKRKIINRNFPDIKKIGCNCFSNETSLNKILKRLSNNEKSAYLLSVQTPWIFEDALQIMDMLAELANSGMHSSQLIESTIGKQLIKQVEDIPPKKDSLWFNNKNHHRIEKENIKINDYVAAQRDGEIEVFGIVDDYSKVKLLLDNEYGSLYFDLFTGSLYSADQDDYLWFLHQKGDEE